MGKAAISKSKERIVWGWDIFGGKEFLSCGLPPVSMGVGQSRPTDDQKISKWLIKRVSGTG